MKKKVSILLMMLLMTSLLSGMDMQRIDEQIVIKETGARSGGDAAVMAITSPKRILLQYTRLPKYIASGG